MRNYNLDWIRVIAMCGVLIDHYMIFFKSNLLTNIGLQIGGVSVEIFFAISAFLFGKKWEQDSYKHFKPLDFMNRRLVRIFIPVWITILITIPLEYLIINRFEPITILFNTIGLGWAMPFGISGHLWFVTMLIILYLCFVAFSYIRLDKINWYWWYLLFGVLTIGYALNADHLRTFSKSGPILFIFLGAAMFSKGDIINKWCKRHKSVIIISSFVSFIISIYIYILGWHDTHKAWSVYSFILAGFLTLLSLLTLLNIKKKYNFIEWLSSISYEVYLIHMPIISLAGCMTVNSYFKLALCLFFTIIASFGLNKLSNKVYMFLGI